MGKPKAPKNIKAMRMQKRREPEEPQVIGRIKKALKTIGVAFSVILTVYGLLAAKDYVEPAIELTSSQQAASDPFSLSFQARNTSPYSVYDVDTSCQLVTAVLQQSTLEDINRTNYLKQVPELSSKEETSITCTPDFREIFGFGKLKSADVILTVSYKSWGMKHTNQKGFTIQDKEDSKQIWIPKALSMMGNSH